MGGRYADEIDPPSDFFWYGKTLIFTSTVVDTVGHLLEGSGEILPLECDAVPLWVFNRLVVVSSLDEERSELKRFTSSGRIMKLLDPVWHPDAIGDAGVFKDSAAMRMGLFFTDRFVDPVRAAGLRGIRFKELWQDDAGSKS